MKKLSDSEIQERFNLKHFDRNILMTVIGNILYACWIFLDLQFIDDDFWPIPFIMRPILPLIMIPICFLPKKIIVKYMHLFITFNYTLGFLLIVPFFFHTQYYLVYFTGACLIPLFLVGGFGINLKQYLLFSFLSLSMMLMFYQQFMMLKSDLLVFTILYTVTIFGLSLVACFFMNKVSKENILLEYQQKSLISEKTSLLLVLSHDMANMINIAQISAKQLYKDYEKNNGTDDSKIARTWMRLLNTLKSQIEVLGSVRDTQALDSGKVEISIGKIDIEDIFNSLSLMYFDICDRKNIKLDFNTVGEIFDVESSGNILKNNIISNLLNNAIKFSHPRSKIKVVAEYNSDEFCISVQDFGVGMHESLITDLFEIDKKTTKPGANGEKGTGFGMPLVKSSVDKLGAEVLVESTQMNDDNPGEHGTKISIIFKRAS